MIPLKISPAELAALIKLLERETAMPTFTLTPPETRSLATLLDRAKFGAQN